MLTGPTQNGTITERHEGAQRLNKRGVKTSNYLIKTKKISDWQRELKMLRCGSGPNGCRKYIPIKWPSWSLVTSHHPWLRWHPDHPDLWKLNNKDSQWGSSKEFQRNNERIIFFIIEKWNNFLWRVWSWLRTNAGGVPNTCKSNGEFRRVYLEKFLVADGWVTRG